MFLWNSGTNKWNKFQQQNEAKSRLPSNKSIITSFAFQFAVVEPTTQQTGKQFRGTVFYSERTGTTE